MTPGKDRVATARVRRYPLTPRRLRTAARHLAARDPDLAAILARRGPPPLWDRPAGFASLVRIILEQQVSLASARALEARLVSVLGAHAPGSYLSRGEPGLRRLGLTRQKARYCIGLARAVRDGTIDLDGLAALDDEAAALALTRLHGIGPWTAQIYLLMVLLRPDIWPRGDLALVAALREVKRLRRVPTAERVAAIAERWRPYRSVAARMLWQEYLARRARSD
jgi:DNA-3-methyladenine glycosylase II